MEHDGHPLAPHAPHPNNQGFIPGDAAPVSYTTPATKPGAPPGGSINLTQATFATNKSKGKAKAKTISNKPTASSVSDRSKGKEIPVNNHGTSNAGKNNEPAAKSQAALDRRAVIERARTRRDALAAELANARVALWETFIEAGTLQFLIKDAGGVIPPDPHAKVD